MKPDTTLLCDADGNLYPSEEPAFEASVGVTNRLVAHLGSGNRFTADELRSASVGMNFRSLAQRLADQYGASLSPEEIQCWVDEENRVVTAHLRRTLRPVQPVLDVLTGLSERFELAVVSSSAFSRLAVCFTVSGLDSLFPAAARFSAQDSLATPSSKPDPAVYRHATRQLGLSAEPRCGVETPLPGSSRSVAAGVQTVATMPL